MGVAYSSGKVASPLKVLVVRNKSEAVDAVINLCEELSVDKVVVGVPLDSEGNETEQAREIKEFGKMLRRDGEMEVVFWNEALTSKQALWGKIRSGQGKKKRKDLDATSAAYILQSYLDSRTSS